MSDKPARTVGNIITGILIGAAILGLLLVTAIMTRCGG